MVETKTQQHQQGMQQGTSMQKGKQGGTIAPRHYGGSGMMDFWRDPFEAMSWPSMWNRPMEQGMLINFPKADISETDSEMRIKCDLPGMKKEDVNIEVDDTGKYLTVSGESKQEIKEEKENVYMIERSYGTFNRRFRMPKNAKPDQVRAKLQDGVLMITIPKEMPIQQQQKRNITWE